MFAAHLSHSLVAAESLDLEAGAVCRVLRDHRKVRASSLLGSIKLRAELLSPALETHPVTLLDELSLQGCQPFNRGIWFENEQDVVSICPLRRSSIRAWRENSPENSVPNAMVGD